MKNLLAVLGLGVVLGGCAQFPTVSSLKDLPTVVAISTMSVVNPVTPKMLSDVEDAATVVFSGLNVWKTSCIKGLINSSCRQQIAAVQVQTRKVPPILAQLRSFVAKNEQVSARSVYDEITALLANIKAQTVVVGG